MYYASLGILATCILFIINFDVLKKPTHGERVRAHSSYRVFLWSVMAYYVTDIFWGFFYTPKYPLLSYIDCVFYFSAMALSVFFWIRYVIKYIDEKKRFFTVLEYIGIFFIAAEFLILFVNFFSRIMFWFDSDGEYRPEIARHVFMLTQVSLFVLVSLYMVIVTIRSSGNIKRRHRGVWLSGAVMAIFITCQTANPFLPFYSIGFILATCIMHTFVLEDEKEARREELEKLLQVEAIQEAELGSARKMAFTDPLTGVKNKNAYLEDVCGIDMRIEDKALKDFALVVFDVNGLKNVNDTQGHEAGDKFIKAASSIICNVFKHSPVYRIGGDEFVAFLMGNDYKNRDALLAQFNQKVEANKASGGVVIACGSDEFRPKQDESYLKIFSRADRKMYARKKALKTN